MKLKLWQQLLFVGCLFLWSCHDKKNEVNIVAHSFENEIELQQNLLFNFNKDLFPDSLLNNWDSTNYFEFSPKVQGMFKWNQLSEIVFSPAMGFEPGTEYTANPTKQLLKKIKKPYFIGSNNVLHFHTAPLRIINTHLLWTRGQDQSSIVVQLDLDLNYEVSIPDAVAKLKLDSKGTNIIPVAVNNGTGKTISVQFPFNGEMKDEDVPVNIQLLSGIAVVHSKYVSTKDTSFEAMIPSRFNLAVSNIVAQHTGLEGIVEVNTTQPIVEEGLKSTISFEPSVKFDVVVNESGFTITSTEMKADQTYALSIDKSLEGVFGGKFKDDYSGQVSFGQLDPAIHFQNTKGMYLSSQGFKNLSMEIVNVPKVQVTVVKVYENNLETFMSRGKQYGYDYSSEGEDGGSYEYYDAQNLGDTVFTKEYDAAKLPKQNSARILHLDFQDKIKDYSGVYILYVASKDHFWVQDSKVLSLSDIGLIVKQERNNMYVFANSIRNASPMSGVKVSFISTNNQMLFTATTDGDGMATFKDIGTKSPGFRIGMVTAKKSDEFTFVWLQQSAVEPSRFDVGGRMPNETGMNAWIYAERNLYRPGETIHVSAIVRDESWGLPNDMPVKLKLNMPNGKEFSTIRKILNEEGSCEAAYNIPSSAMTGTYVLEVLSGNDVLLNSYNFSIEDFMPDRLKQEVKIDKPEYNMGDSVRVNMQADNLFGTPAAGRNYECELNLNKMNFSPKNYDNYTFDIKNNFEFVPVLRSGKTNEKGGARESFILPTEIKEAGYLKGNISATVFDETGRPVHRFEHFDVYTQPVFLGIKDFDWYTSTRKPMRIGLIAVDKKGAPQNQNALVAIIKKEWNTVIEQNGTHYRYVSRSEEKMLTQQTIKLSGNSSYFNYTPQLNGEYEIRVYLPGSNSFVSREFYAWGWNDGQYTSFEVNNEGNVDIKLDKDKYSSGEKAHVLFTTPFDGRMLVTVERDHLLEHFFLDVKNKSASLDLSTNENYLPNAYITATLFRPMDGSSLPLTVAHGFKSMTVENTRNHIPVEVKLADKTRSKTKKTISIKTAPNAFVTVAAVDEGILQVKNFRTPDPYDYFYQKVALSVGSYDIYPLLLPEIKLNRNSTGGDEMAADQNLRVNPMFVNRVKNVSFWSGILQADGGGNLNYDIDIPQFSDDLRVMAVAYKGKAMGGSDKHMKVADPIVISTALPRFLSPKDEVVMPVTLSNTTNKDAQATVSATTSGGVTINGESVQQVRIPANREARVVFHVAAAQAMGAGKVVVTIKAMNETFVNETEIGVRPTASLQKLTGSGIINDNQTITVNPTNNFIPATFSGKLIVSKSPLVQFAKNLNDLVQYPYGCVEQTTSAAFPQLYYGDMVKSITGKESSDLNPSYNVQQAILKLQSMQLSNGALAYWPGYNGGESWWGSIYATHFLLEAKKAGFEVNANTLKRLQQYLKMRLQKKETEIYYYNDKLQKEIAAKEVAYSLYVLALAGEPQTATMNYYKGNSKLLSLDSKYLLSAAYSLSGQRAQALQVLPHAFEGEKSNAMLGGSFYSYIRDMGISLNALMDIDPNNAQIGILSRLLSEQVKQARYLSTQENVWAMLAFGKIARKANSTTATASITANGKNIALMNGQNYVVDLKQAMNQPVQIKTSGKGAYYYFWETKGITADGSYKQEDNFLKVRRSYWTRNGNPISGNQFQQNDLIVVMIELTPQQSGMIDNIAITDMLPAGFEIENTRLTDLPEMDWMKNGEEPEYKDVRDDRINLFTFLSGKTKVFYYMVRAVSPGVYQQGPVMADAMYNGNYHSYYGAGVIKVMEK